MNIKIKTNYLSFFKEGYPLIKPEFCNYTFSGDDEGKIVNLVDSKDNFIAKAYLGKQNKGIGWVFSDSKNDDLNKFFISTKLRNAINFRKDFFSDDETNCFRLFNGIGDGIGGLTIDYFDGFALINWYNKGIFERSEVIVNLLDEILNPKGIYQKIRFKSKDKNYISPHIKGSKTPEGFYVLENGVKYSIDFYDGDMVGIFLDQREVRKYLTTHFSSNKTVLNTFSYTGAFSVAAIKGNSEITTSVDLAKRSLDWTKENFKINNFAVQDQNVIVEDVFNYFKYANRKNFKYDIVILDPPSFARSKRKTFSVLKNYTELVESIIPLVNKNGYIIASTNNSQLYLNVFKSMIKNAFSKSDRYFKIEKTFRLPKDFRISDNFREGNYLKVMLIKVD